ncbi:MAG: hypothetical protein H0T79_06175 [Deltaproteobacteria bacterium]|nr:hypothetical protein [Deltaproteobacteria bacterium]
MLVATSTRDFAGSTLRTAIFLERQFRAHLISRDRLVFDTRYSPPAKTTSAFVHLYAHLRGECQLVGGERIAGPHAYVLAETEFDRVIPGATTFRSSGAPAVIVELRVPITTLRAPVGLRHGPLALPAPIWDAYLALEAAVSGGATQDTLGAHLHQIIDRLGAAKLLSIDLVRSVVGEEPERYARLWTVLRPLYEDYATSASLKQISVLAKLSLRQLGRDLGDLTRDFGLFGGGFRDTMRVLRLRAAVLLLSAPESTPGEVARVVGYGSLDAMGRAFRDAGLPAPSSVQDAVRWPA